MKINKCISAIILIAIPAIFYITNAGSSKMAQNNAAGSTVTSSYFETNADTATGQILRQDRTINNNLAYIWGQNADFRITGLDARSYKDYTISLGDTATHPSVISVPSLFGIDSNTSIIGYRKDMTGKISRAGFFTTKEFKWLNFMVFTPLIKGEINENPTLRVSNKDSIEWIRPYAVISDSQNNYDTVFCREPLCDTSYFPRSRHLSDPNLSLTHDRKLLLVVRVSYLGADSIMGMTSTDGIEWSDPFRIYGGRTNKVISPSVILNRDNSYRLYFVNGMSKDTCISYIECDCGNPYNSTSSWSTIPVVCTVQAGLSNIGITDGVDRARYPWHFEIQRYENQYVMGWVARLVYYDGAYFSISTDGINFVTRPDAVLPVAKTTNSPAWDILAMYKFSFTFRNTKEGLIIPVWYSAYNSRNFPYIGFTTLHFGKSKPK
jgi:hypothetical protein